jgi:hypothetical protein
MPFNIGRYVTVHSIPDSQRTTGLVTSRCFLGIVCFSLYWSEKLGCCSVRVCMVILDITRSYFTDNLTILIVTADPGRFIV